MTRTTLPPTGPRPRTIRLRLAGACLAILSGGAAAGGSLPTLRAESAPDPEAEPIAGRAAEPNVPDGLVVIGVGGAEDYATRFARTAAAWQSAAERAGQRFEMVAGSEGSPVPVKDRLREALAALVSSDEAAANEVSNKDAVSSDDARPVALPPFWIVLVGHGSFDGREAKFNLPGPDLTPDELAAWVRDIRRPLVVMAGGASSSPFLPALSGKDRIIVTATKSPSEQSFAYFGEHFIEVLASESGDIDRDGATSVLEAFLGASQAVREFFDADLRIASEEALLDDNGDGRGTLAVQFNGVSPVPASDGVLPEGSFANQIALLPNPAERDWSPEQIARRNGLERELLEVRMKRDRMEHPAYLDALEDVLTRLAEFYHDVGALAAPPPPPAEETPAHDESTQPEPPLALPPAPEVPEVP